MYKLFFVYLLLLFCTYKLNSQVIINDVALISNESTSAEFCFNNTKLMSGNSVSDRYIVYYNSDTVFLNVLQNGVWLKKIAYMGNNIKSATMTFFKDTTWICWKEGVSIKSRYTADKGNTWSNVINVSQNGNASAPSIYASNNGKIHFVWQESASDTIVFHRVYYNDAFLTEAYPLSIPSGQGQWPSVIAVGDTIFCAWKEGPLPTKVWFRSSYDGGNTWNNLPSQPTATLLSLSKDPNLAYSYDSISGTSYIYLAYDSQNKIYLQKSTDFGNTWSDPYFISNSNKLSQFAHIESNNSGFIGISYEQRPFGASLFDDTKKDVGFIYSNNWGEEGSFSVDTLAYTHNSLGSAYPSFNKIDKNNYYLAWLTKDTVNQQIKVLERLIQLNSTSNIKEILNNKFDISFYPNPTSVYIQLKSELSLNKASILINDLFGNEVLFINNVYGISAQIPINNIKNGLYFVKVIQDDKIITIQRISVMK